MTTKPVIGHDKDCHGKRLHGISMPDLTGYTLYMCMHVHIHAYMEVSVEEQVCHYHSSCYTH